MNFKLRGLVGMRSCICCAQFVSLHNLHSALHGLATVMISVR